MHVHRHGGGATEGRRRAIQASTITSEDRVTAQRDIDFSGYSPCLLAQDLHPRVSFS